MEIPWKSLEEEVLRRLIDELVTRDGTDYGMKAKTRSEKIDEVKAALDSGEAVILWDTETETASISEKNNY